MVFVGVLAHRFRHELMPRHRTHRGEYAGVVYAPGRDLRSYHFFLLNDERTALNEVAHGLLVTGATPGRCGPLTRNRGSRLRETSPGSLHIPLIRFDGPRDHADAIRLRIALEHKFPGAKRAVVEVSPRQTGPVDCAGDQELQSEFAIVVRH